MPRGIADATDIAAQAIGERFRRGAVDGKIQAHIVSIGKWVRYPFSCERSFAIVSICRS